MEDLCAFVRKQVTLGSQPVQNVGQALFIQVGIGTIVAFRYPGWHQFRSRP